ncbi:type II toxin-antitoxin system VapC family toxin [Candidatus Poribacteria bacterium]|nr:type II toxin-antitoxin system VapC family toxin [Candidatus Poribacteria bacterium]MYG05631.1 type II toxin-antitoxin system VapC family toxin [Candidatus Poribacteria bacterium]MYK21867.1 type II toxin-antitoxin system VapC family toxin [Candidatus Poribacteria bacterium]
MGQLTLYLDLNLYCRPFNDQTQLRMSREARAVDIILDEARNQRYTIYWSYVLHVENSLNQNLVERQIVIRQSTSSCFCSIIPADDIRRLADQIQTLSSISRYDAEHIACAERAGCDYLLTGDDRLLRRFNRLKVQRVLPLRVVLQNPVDFLETQLEKEKSHER